MSTLLVPHASASKAAMARKLSEDAMFGANLMVLCVDRFGAESLYWTPDALRRELNREFDANTSQGNMDRLAAAIYVLTDDAFQKSVDEFIDVCNVLSGGPPAIESFDFADVAECAWGVAEATVIWPPEDDDEAYDAEIVGYVRAWLVNDGFVSVPEQLLSVVGDWSPPMVSVEHDAEMSAALSEVHAGKTAAVNDWVRERLDALGRELAELPLLNRARAEPGRKSQS